MVTKAVKWAWHMVNQICRPSPLIAASVSTASIPVVANITKVVPSLSEEEEKQLRAWIRELESQLTTQPAFSFYYPKSYIVSYPNVDHTRLVSFCPVISSLDNTFLYVPNVRTSNRWCFCLVGLSIDFPVLLSVPWVASLHLPPRMVLPLLCLQ